MKVELVCEEVKEGITCGGGPDAPNTTHLAVQLVSHPLNMQTFGKV